MDNVKVNLTFHHTSRLLRFLGFLSVVLFITYASVRPRGAADLFKFVAGSLFNFTVALGDFLVRLVS